ncbi:MAG: hypothetical protein KGY60_01110 [Bacteroidales bacterium]|nr:hypothetical protein [Bacteroidales bacterium]
MRKNKIRVALLFVASLFALQVANGQGCMEASSEGVNIAGYLQPQWEYAQTTDGGNSNSFTFNRARLGVLGNIPYDISYYLMVDFSRFKPGSPYVLDAFITYNRFDWLNASVGQFKSPLSLEQNTACQSLHTVYRSKVVNELAAPQRDLGVMLSGKLMDARINYYIAFMNDYKMGFKDENKEKSLKSRLTFSPIEQLQVGGSFAYGMTGPESDNTKTRLGGELQLTLGNFLLQGEYLWGDDTGDYTTGGGCDGTPIEYHTGGVTRNGYFVQAMYMTEWSIQPVLKYEAYDSDVSIDNNTETVLTYGMNYFMNDWTRLQLNYRYRAEGDDEVPNDQFVIQAQVIF